MFLNARSSAICLALAVSGTLLSLIGASSAIAAPFDSLEQPCKPKLAGTHACLESVPAYSYHLGIVSEYSGDLCLELGDWEGENRVVVEWDGLQTQLQLTGKAGIQQLLEPVQREGRSSAIVLYSDRPILPRIATSSCGRGRETRQVTAVSWPEETGARSNVAQLPEAESGQGTEL